MGLNDPINCTGCGARWTKPSYRLFDGIKTTMNKLLYMETKEHNVQADKETQFTGGQTVQETERMSMNERQRTLGHILFAFTHCVLLKTVSMIIIPLLYQRVEFISVNLKLGQLL